MFAAHLRLNNCLIVTVRSLTTALNSSRYVSNVPMATSLIQRLTCSNGQCSHLPLCHTDLTGKETMECKSEGGATDSTASCSKSRTFQDGSMSLSYRCTEQSCENAFILVSSCDRCTSDVSCRDSEVCREGSTHGCMHCLFLQKQHWMHNQQSWLQMYVCESLGRGPYPRPGVPWTGSICWETSTVLPRSM